MKVDPKDVRRLFVIRTDAPCKRCNQRHEYATTNCALAVFVDMGTALWVAKSIEGSRVKEINEVPSGIPYVLYLQKGGKRDPKLPGGVSRIPA